MQGRSDAALGRAAALEQLGEALRDLAAHAAGRGQILLYEPLNRYETDLFNRQADAGAWLGTLGAGNVRLLSDLYHMNIEEADIASALLAAGDLVGHVHFADSNRRAMGSGHTDAVAVMAALKKIRYNGYLSAEILPLPDGASAARQTIAALRRLDTGMAAAPGALSSGGAR